MELILTRRRISRFAYDRIPYRRCPSNLRQTALTVAATSIFEGGITIAISGLGPRLTYHNLGEALKIAAGKKENNALTTAKGGDLRLISKTHSAKSVFHIGICEKIFTPPHKIAGNASEELPPLARVTASDENANRLRFSTGTTKLIAFVAFGLAVGYFVGKSKR